MGNVMCNVPLHSGANTCENTVRGLKRFLDELGVMDFAMQKLRLKNFISINKVQFFFFKFLMCLENFRRFCEFSQFSSRIFTLTISFQSFPQFLQFSSRNKGFLFISPTEKPPIWAVPPIFRTSTCLWDNRNWFVSLKL